MAKTIKKNDSKTLLAPTSPIKFLFLPLLIFSICMLSGCLKEQPDEIVIKGEHNPDESNDPEVSVIIQIPESITGITKALSHENECEIESIDILIFGFNPNTGVKELEKVVRSRNIQTNVDTVYIKTARTYLPEGTYDLVFLANGENWVRTSYASVGGNIPKSESYDAITRRLKASLETGKGWVADPDSSDYTPIPMYGHKEQIKITSSGTNLIDSVEVERVLSKINITMEDSVKSKFKLHTVRLYNYNREGFLFPDIYPGDTTELAPLEPPLRYKTNDTNLLRSIYAFEFNNSPTLKHIERFCLVLGGEYNNEGSEHYYRVDFQTSQGFININRNHSYYVHIIDVKGPGSGDEDLAFRGINQHLQTTMVNWEEVNFPGGGL